MGGILEQLPGREKVQLNRLFYFNKGEKVAEDPPPFPEPTAMEG